MGSTLIPPTIRDARRLTALREANLVREGRMILLRRLYDRSREESCWMGADMVEDPPELLAGMEAWKFLDRVRGVGGESADRLLLAARVGPFVQLGRMTVRQRAALAAALRLRGQRAGS